MGKFIVSIFFLISIVHSSWAREVRDLSGLGWTFQFENEAVESVSIPHTWNALDGADGPKVGKKHSALSVQGDGYKRGKATYTKKLDVSPKEGKRYFLRFEGASVIADIVVNGKNVGKHEGAFGAFCFEITSELKAKDNVLTVDVDNTQTDYIVPMSGDFSTFGGLYRGVVLIETDSVCIQADYYASPGVFISQDISEPKEAKIKVKTRLSVGTSLENLPQKGVLNISIIDARGRFVASKEIPLSLKNGEQEIVANMVIKNPVLWQGRENPALYSVIVRLVLPNKEGDTVIQPLGLRSFSINNKGFFLNGKRMQLKGVNRHQDKEGKGWALSKDDENIDMKLILDMGADALRTAHYPQTENIYNICDKSGVLVWSEVSAIEKVFDTENFRNNIKQQAKEMVLQHYNHPSIILWGIFNEIYHQCGKEIEGINMEAELRTLNSYIKELDPSRLTICGTNRFEKIELNTIADVLCANLYPGWYGGGPEGMGGQIDNYMKKYSDRGFGVSEYGHGASINHHENPVKQPGTTAYWHPEEWQSRGHEGNYKGIVARPQVWGTYIWNMFDFATDGRIEGERAGMNDKGLVTYDRKVRKDAYYFYKANWNPEHMVYITSRRFSDRQQAEVPVKVYSNGDKVTLVVNGENLGDKVPDEQKIVHWDAIALKQGKNIISAKSVSQGKTVQDSCEWLYIPSPTPVEKDKFDAVKK